MRDMPVPGEITIRQAQVETQHRSRHLRDTCARDSQQAENHHEENEHDNLRRKRPSQRISYRTQ